MEQIKFPPALDANDPEVADRLRGFFAPNSGVTLSIQEKLAGVPVMLSFRPGRKRQVAGTFRSLTRGETKSINNMFKVGRYAHFLEQVRLQTNRIEEDIILFGMLIGPDHSWINYGGMDKVRFFDAVQDNRWLSVHDLVGWFNHYSSLVLLSPAIKTVRSIDEALSFSTGDGSSLAVEDVTGDKPDIDPIHGIIIKPYYFIKGDSGEPIIIKREFRKPPQKEKTFRKEKPQEKEDSA